MPEKTIPMAVSSLMRLFSFKYPTQTEQSNPATKAPMVKGKLNQKATTMPGRTA